MKRTVIARGYVLAEMLVETHHALGYSLVDIGGQTLVAPNAAKLLSPGQHNTVELTGLGQIHHKIETFQADITVKITQNPPTNK